MKNVIKSILFVFIFLVLVQLFSIILMPKTNLFKYNMFDYSAYGVLKQKEDSIDVIFAGDSLVYSGISPMDIWYETGYTSYDVANPAQPINDTYKGIKIAIESQHPKIVFMEANVLLRDPKKVKTDYKLIWFYKKYLPIIEYHNNWKKLLFNFVHDSYDYSWNDYNKGFIYVPKIKKASDVEGYMDDTDKTPATLPNGNKDNLKRIKKLCDENNVKLIIISTPNGRSWNYKKYLATKQVTKELEIEYIDLNVDNPLDINWETETKDGGDHLNYQGSTKVTKFLSEYLKNTNLLTDHRNDPEYDEWNKAYELFTKQKNKS